MPTVHSELRSDNPAFDAEMDAIRAELRAEAADEIDPDWWITLDAAETAGDFDHVDVDGVQVTLAAWLNDEAARYRRLGTKVGAWLANELTGLAGQATSLWATTTEAFDHRREVADAYRAEDLEYIGYQRGLSDAREDGPGLFGRPHRP